MSAHVAGAFFLCIWRCCNVKILLNIRRVCGGSDAGVRKGGLRTIFGQVIQDVSVDVLFKLLLFDRNQFFVQDGRIHASMILAAALICVSEIQGVAQHTVSNCHFLLRLNDIYVMHVQLVTVTVPGRLHLQPVPS